MTTPISCFELALITVEEHMVMDPGLGFTKRIVALIINKCERKVANFSKTVSSKQTNFYKLC